MICNSMVCGSTHDVVTVAAAIVIALVVSGVLIWVMESGRGGRR